MSTEAKTESEAVSTQPSGREELEVALEAASGYEDTPATQEEFVWGDEKGQDSVEEPEVDASTSTVIGVSENGKKMIAKPDKVYAGYTIHWADGGVVPKALEGRWSNIDKARTATTVYLNSK